MLPKTIHLQGVGLAKFNAHLNNMGTTTSSTGCMLKGHLPGGL
jgi:hypothetical protein